MQLALVALVAATIALPAKGVPAALRWQLPLIVCLFLFLSLDEAASIHEHITRLSRTRPWVPTLDGHHAWVLPYLAVGILIALSVRKSALWLFSSDAATFWITLAGIATLLSGAVGIEVTHRFVIESPLGREIASAAKEWLEILGVSLLLYAMLRVKALIETPRPAP